MHVIVGSAVSEPVLPCDLSKEDMDDFENVIDLDAANPNDLGYKRLSSGFTVRIKYDIDYAPRMLID